MKSMEVRAGFRTRLADAMNPTGTTEIMDTHKTDAELSVLSSGDEVRQRAARYGLMTSVLSEMIFATKRVSGE